MTTHGAASRSTDAAARLAWALKALSAPARLRIIDLLRDRALCVNALTVRLGLTQGAVSQHLRVLREAGFVVCEKRGYYVHYMLNPPMLKELRESLVAFLTEGEGATARQAGTRPCARGMAPRGAERRKR